MQAASCALRNRPRGWRQRSCRLPPNIPMSRKRHRPPHRERIVARSSPRDMSRRQPRPDRELIEPFGGSISSCESVLRHIVMEGSILLQSRRAKPCRGVGGAGAVGGKARNSPARLGRDRHRSWSRSRQCRTPRMARLGALRGPIVGAHALPGFVHDMPDYGFVDTVIAHDNLGDRVGQEFVDGWLVA